MNHDELWDAIDVQRVRTCDLLTGLTPREWERPSLCEGWTVRDVAAHLTMQQATLVEALPMVLRHPGGLNHVINASARERAALPTDQLIARIRAMTGSRRHNVGVTAEETLLDIVVHGQDIAIPLGRALEVPPEVAATAASRVWAYRLSWKGRMSAKVFHALPYDDHRLVATDIDWAAGEGTEIRGPVLAILMLLTGRPVVIPQLGGPGATELAARLAPARPPG